MGLLASDKVWPAIAQLARDCDGRRWCAVSYVTDARIISLRAGDRLVVDASDTSITSGATSAQELQRLFDIGVSIHSMPKLHAKLYLFADEFIVGSCNLSASSQTALIEMAFRSADKLEVRAAEDVFEKLVAIAQVIDEKFLERILALPIVPTSPEVFSDGADQHLWRLERPPPIAVSGDMKCYMQALFEAQMGGVIAGVEFRLWPGSKGSEAFRGHMLPKADRLRGGMGTYTLTSDGVEHFGKRKTDPTLVAQFLSAIRSGDPRDLPASYTHHKLVSL